MRVEQIIPSSEVFSAEALFARNAADRGEALAVKDANHAYSYRELNARANALARQLRGRGVETGDRVVIYSERAVHAVVAVLAVMKAGGVFVPVSLDTPAARLGFILNDAGSKLLLTDSVGRKRLAGCDERFDSMAIDQIGPPGADDPAGVTRVEPNDLVYIIYTSGTSGQPKGVMIEHGGLARRFEDWDRPFALTRSRPRILQIAKFGFDVFVGDLVKALCSGGALVICPAEVVADPAGLYRWLVDEAIDYVDIVPSVLRALVDYLEVSGQDLASLGIINCGADLWTKEEYQRSRQITKTARLFNGYGVTECTVESTLFEDDGALDSKIRMPIGRALASDQILIVDDALAPVANGGTGEICIGGPCVARGYLNRPELSQQAFFTRAGGDGRPVRFYRTGDLGRVDADGVFEFLGRIDSQIKINGHRIELEEIERVLERLPGVAQAVVCFDQKLRALTAFVKSASATPLNASEISAHLRRQVPAYMVPSGIVCVEDFPLNQNAKVDRSRLTNELAIRTNHDPRRNIDLISVVNEFVKPSANFGVLISGEASRVELLVLLDDHTAMKRRKQDVAGNPVEYLPAPEAGETRVSVLLDGLEIRLDFLAGQLAAENGRKDIASRLTSDWVLHGHDVVDSWRLRYQTQSMASSGQ